MLPTKEVIIATSNRDKFNLYSRLLTALGLDSNFTSLTELNITNDVPETGSILERAIQKAQYCLEHLTPDQLEFFDAIFAIDTGLKLPTLNLESPEAKKITTQMLRGELINAGDPIHTINGVDFILLPDQTEHTRKIEIPFEYLGNPDNRTVEEGKNVLGFVMSQPDIHICNEDIPKDVDTEYRLQFFRSALEEIINQINRS